MKEALLQMNYVQAGKPPLRSNPEKIAVPIPLISKDREYVEYAGNIRDALENEKIQGHVLFWNRSAPMLGRR